MIISIERGTEAPPQDPFTKLYFYDGSGNLEYECWARSESNPQSSEAKWAIKKYTWTAGPKKTGEYWADGDSKCDNVADNRATLTYK